MDYLIDLKKQNLSGKVALEGGISLGVDTDGNIKKIDESGAISDIGGSVDESRLLPETGSVSSDSAGNPVIFKAISRIDNTYWLCLPLNEDTHDRSTYDVATEVYGTVNIVSNAPSSPGGSAFFNGSSCLHGTLPAQFGTSDFTVRLWMMAPAISSGSSSHTIFSTRRGNQTDADTFALLCTTEGRLYIYSDGNITSYGTDTPFALQSGVWYHVAVVRKSGVLTIYVNGEVYNSATFTNSLTRQIFGLGASWTGSSYSEAGTVYLTSLDVLNYAAYDGAFTTPAYQPGILAGAGYEVATDSELKDMLSAAGIDESRLLPENPANGDIPCFDATATIGGGNDANTKILLHFDADEIKDEAAGNAAPVTITKKTGTITVVEGGKWGKCAKYVTGSMTVATNLDELNANNWVVSGWFNPDENNHGVSYPVWLSMDDQNTHGFSFDSTGRYGESDGPLFYMDTPPASGTWHWLAIVKYSGGLRFYLNGAFLNEISAQQRANFCSTLAIGGFAGTYAAGSTERTFSGLVDEVRLQYIPDDEITQWTGTSIAVPDAPYSKPQTVGEWGKFNKSELAMKSELTAALTGKVNQSELAAYQKKSEAFSGQYSDLAGKPSTFPPAAHTHTIANVTDLQATVNKAHEHANKAALDKISETGGKLAYGGTAVGGVSSWTELADKPSTFPPAAHSHTIANVTDLQTMLNSKAASAHGHAVADVTGLQSLLDGKAAVGHTHAAADVAGLATTLAGKVSSVNGLTPDDSGALVLPQATSGAAGLMAAADKLKLDTFTNYTEKSGTENSGYIRFPGGLIMQFGSKEVLTPEAFVSGSIVFPRSFVDKPLSVTASVEIDNLTNAPFAISLYAPNTISVVFSGPIVGLSDTLEKIVLHWMAIGIENKPPTNPSSEV